MTEPFARHLCKIVVAQICKQMGFQAIKASSSEALVDLLIRCIYICSFLLIQKDIEEIGTRSHDFAELAGRTECNFMDVKQTFQDLNIKLNDLITFVNTDDVQFPIGIPHFQLQLTQ
jgi:transcription initiation factor TFIID subunit 8